MYAVVMIGSVTRRSECITAVIVLACASAGHASSADAIRPRNAILAKADELLPRETTDMTPLLN